MTGSRALESGASNSMRSGGLAPTMLNAANEIAVQAFLDRRIGFLDISRVVEATLDAAMRGSNGGADDLESVLGCRRAGAGDGRRDLPTGGSVRDIACWMPFAVLSPGVLWEFPPSCSSSRWWCSSTSWAISRWRAACGVKVDVFSIGFGKEVFGFNDRTRHALEDELAAHRRLCEIRRRRQCRLHARCRSGRANSRRRSAGACCSSSRYGSARSWPRPGPLANFVLAIVVLTGLFLASGYQAVSRRVDRSVVAKGSPAAAAGIRSRRSGRWRSTARRSTIFRQTAADHLRSAAAKTWPFDAGSRSGKHLTVHAVPRLVSQPDESGETGIEPVSSVSARCRRLQPMSCGPTAGRGLLGGLYRDGQHHARHSGRGSQDGAGPCLRLTSSAGRSESPI